MHNYAGNPATFPPNVGLIDDADLNPATASTINAAPEGNADRTAYLYKRIAPSSALNWRELVTGITPQSGGGGSPVAGQNCVFWDYSTNVWMVPFIDGNFPTVDGGVILCTTGFDNRLADQWYQFGGSGGPTFTGFGGVDFPAAMTFNPGGGYLVAIVSPGAARTKIDAINLTSGPASVLGFPGSTTITSCEMDFLIGYAVAGFGATDSANTNFWYSPDGTTWTPVGVGSVLGSGAPELMVKRGSLGANPGVIVMPVIAPVSVTTYAYWTSIDGHTWIQRSLSAIGATETPIGLAFGGDATGPCWILATQVGASSTSKYYRSSDGVAWSFISQTTTRAVQDLVALGGTPSVWVATVFDSTSGSPIYGPPTTSVYGGAGASYVVYSTDGANTWFRSQGTLSKNLTGTGRQQRARLANSFNQVCVYNSLQLRFSDAAFAVSWS